MHLVQVLLWSLLSLLLALFQIQSAFMIDLNQVSLALRNMTSRSLLIIDEFGKGTVSSGSSVSRLSLAYGTLTRTAVS